MTPTLPAILDHPSEDQVRRELEAICSSRTFRESAQLRTLIRFLVEEKLAGRSDGLKEYSLGMEVFHRGPQYDPRRDAIVRVQASLLRKKLDAYYAQEGASSEWRLAVPRGGYVPVLQPAQEPTPAPAPPIPVGLPAKPRWVLLAAVLLLGSLLGVLGTWLVAGRLRSEPLATSTDFPQLWAPFLRSDTGSVIGFGVPLFFAGGGTFFRDTRTDSQDLEPDSIAAVSKALGVKLRPEREVYTGIGEALATSRLVRFLDSHRVPLTTSNANHIGISDWRERNLIIVSSLRFATLLKEFQLPTDFEFDGAGSGGIRNPRPLNGEPSRFDYQVGVGVSTAYAVISLYPGLAPGKRLLHIGGLHTWCTQAAAEFILDPRQLRSLRTAFEQDRKDGKRGKPSPFFQILLRVEGQENRLHAVEYVTHHYLYLPDRPLKRN